MKNAAILLIFILCTACASKQDYSAIQPIPVGETVSVRTVADNADRANARNRGESAGRNAAKGAGAGALMGAYGGAVVGAGCGPALIVCSPLMAIVGLGAGTVVGGIGGGIYGAATGLPKDKAARFEAVVTQTIEEQGPALGLQGEFVANSSGRWLISDEQAGHTVILSLESIKVTADKKHVLSLRVTSGMKVLSEPQTKKHAKKYTFTYASHAMHVDTWLADDGAALKEELIAAAEVLSADMLFYLK